MVQDGRALAGVVVAAIAAVAIVASMRAPGSRVRVGPRLRLPEGAAEERETLLEYEVLLDPSEEPPEGYRMRNHLVPLGLVVTAFWPVNGKGGPVIAVANWPTRRGKGPATRWPFVVATISKGPTGVRIEYHRKSKDGILKSGWVPLRVGMVQSDKGLLDALMDVAHHVMRGERAGPDVVWLIP